uniref:B box-type domain-containing protein n=1 Tax=Lepisosteus oculatus TaxID=7918 RepID=W5NKJ1_LEPOC
VTRDHTVLTESKGVRSAPTLFCPAHREEPLKLFCVSCDQVTCRDCQLTYHRHHRYQFVEEAVSSQRQHILSLLEHVRQQHERVKKMILELDLRSVCLLGFPFCFLALPISQPHRLLCPPRETVGIQRSSLSSS